MTLGIAPRLSDGKVPRDEFSPSAIHNGCRLPS